MYIPPKHCTQLSQTEDLITSGTFTTTTDLPNTIIAADVNVHSTLWYAPPKDHRGEMIKNIQLNSNNITLNTNTATHLPPNQTQSTSPEMTTALDLHDCTSWQTIHSLTFDHLPLLTTLSIQHKTKTTHSHFTKTITNYQKTNWTSLKQHVENLIFSRPHITNVNEANKHFIKELLDADRFFIL